MNHLISILFILEFLLLLYVLCSNLFKNGVSFKVGISFGVLFFIFVPVWVMIITGTLQLSRADFGYTILNDVILKENIRTSFMLILYVFSIIIYLYFPSRYPKIIINYSFKPRIKSYITLYLIGMLVIFIGSGLLDGGNWYHNRHHFFKSTGLTAVLIAFIVNSLKVLIISSLVYLWDKNERGFYKFILLVVTFVFWDMIFSGNRIYLFCTAILIGLIYLKKFPKKTLILTPVVVPVIFVLGYFVSIFRHIRGPLFQEGIPTFGVFIDAFKRAMTLEPPNPEYFFMGISESVNVNVIYDIFNSYNDYLYGATYLKPFIFYIPRSFWETKPESITILAANSFGGSSLVTTLIGEMQMNFAIFGAIIIPFLLWYFERFLTRSLRNYGSISPIVGFFFGLLIFRMPFSDEFLVFIFLLLILRFFDYFTRKKFILRLS